jgi:tetratricopeptide (TPR) repeat protein
MKFNQFTIITAFLLFNICQVPCINAADFIYRKSETRRITGTITDISKTEIVVQSTAKNKPPTHIPANDIKEVKWNNEPPELTLLRSAERKNSFAKALAGYKKVYEKIGSSQKNLRNDLSFLIARVTSQLAAGDDKYLEDAISLLEKFRKMNPNHFRYYESLILLNKMYQKKNDPEQVRQISELIATAPWKDFRDSGKIEKAYALLSTGDADQALELFEIIILEYNKQPENVQALKAILGKAKCQLKLKELQKAENSINHLLDHANPESKQFLSETFLVQGELYRSQNLPKDAILAYLRIDLIFHKDKKAHAEALYWLAILWKQVGHETRSSKNSEILKTKYPESSWISKLN